MANSKVKTSLQIVDKAVEDNQTKIPRFHVGASDIGSRCARKIFYSLRWYSNTKHPAKKLRIFDAGHVIEEEIIADLKLVEDFKVYDKNEEGEQHHFSELNGHYKGYADLLIEGLIEDPRLVLAEIKSTNSKLCKKRMRNLSELPNKDSSSAQRFTNEEFEEEFPENFAQFTALMDGLCLPATFFVFQDKDNSERHQLWFEADPGIAEELRRKADDVINAELPPRRISERPGWWYCREMCDHRGVCHLGEAVEKNCRTCRHSKPNTEDGAPAWWCDKKDKELTKEAQIKGCDEWNEFPRA